jgi:hypothetical protein
MAVSVSGSRLRVPAPVVASLCLPPQPPAGSADGPEVGSPLRKSLRLAYRLGPRDANHEPHTADALAKLAADRIGGGRRLGYGIGKDEATEGPRRTMRRQAVHDASADPLPDHDHSL